MSVEVTLRTLRLMVSKGAMSTPPKGSPADGLTVTVAAFDDLDDALHAQAVLCSTAGPRDLFDVAIIERTLDEVTGFHGYETSGWGRGILASAVCGVLWPPCLVVGALAGSVGGRTMTQMRRGFSMRAIGTLSTVLESGSFFVVAVSDLLADAVPTTLRAQTRHLETVQARVDATTLREALEADTADG
jgi:hypothetical protein